MDAPSLSIDEFGPLPVRRPASVAELGEVVREAVTSGRGVYPVGGRTTLDVGFPPIMPGFAVDTTALDQVIDYPARDMTITVRAGITVAKLQEVLAAENQWLPVDVPRPEAATVGGAVALNKSGPRRFGYGTLRDYVIGISFVTDEGTEVKAGGRVVKNVAGYDLMKLQTGAVGTLGVITQLTLKVRPKPEASAAVAFGCEAADLGPVLDLLHGSKSRPVAVELLNREVARLDGGGLPGISTPFVLVVGFEEKAATVEWQVSTLLEELKGAPISYVTRLSDPGARWAEFTELQTYPESRFIWKANVLPSRVAELAPTAAPDSLLHAEAMNGIVWSHDPQGLRAEAAGGSVVVRRCPTERKRQLPVWGRDRGDRELMRHVKRTLDPNNVFNPGRLFGDL